MKSAKGNKGPTTRPFVAATFAMTVDGKITTRTFAPVDFTSREDKAHLFRHRSLGDAVLIGAGTLRRDNVRLGLPGAELRDERISRGQTPYPIRVIVSNSGRIDPSLKIFESKISPIVIFSTAQMPKKFQDALGRHSILHLSRGRSVDLAEMLQCLRFEYRVRRVACEGGAELFRALLEHDLVDELNLTIAPLLFGGANAPTLTGLCRNFLPASVHCTLKEIRTIGDECFLTYRVQHRR